MVDGAAEVKVEQQLKTAQLCSVTTAANMDTMLDSVQRQPAVQEAAVPGRA